MTAPTERAKLKSLLVHGCGAPPNADEWETSPIGRSLIHNGVTGFDLLLLLSRENIQSLEIPAHRADGTDHDARKLSIADQQLLISALCAFHHYSNAAGKALRLASFPTNYYTVYRAGIPRQTLYHGIVLFVQLNPLKANERFQTGKSPFVYL